MKARRRSPLARPLIFGIVAFLCAVGPPPAAAETPKGAASESDAVRALVRYFDTVVFGAEIDSKLASKVVAKWAGPLRISIQGRVKKAHRVLIGKHARTLARLTGLEFEAPKTGHNLYILFVRRAEMATVPIKGVDPGLLEKLAAPAGCYFISAKKPPSRIILSYIVVNAERQERAIEHCLLEEMTQSLGLPNDSDMARPSIFSDLDQLTELSRSDRILVKTLYDARMKAGLSRRPALRVAKAVIEELHRSMP